MSTATETQVQSTVSTVNFFTYTTVNKKVLGNIYQIMHVLNKDCNLHSINICKLTNNPFRGLGKEFVNWEAAANAYKSTAMKTALILAESEIDSYFINLLIKNN